MFTGIVTDVGKVRGITKAEGQDTLLEIETAYAPDTMDIGASIACNGICLTVIDKGIKQGNWFSVEASQETLDCTTMGSWEAGDEINLERSLKAGDEMGGHIVSGHVDGIGRIAGIEDVDGSKKFRFQMPDELARFVAAKGSIAINGISLTVNTVDKNYFEVNIIPHTQEVTALRNADIGHKVNLEIDMLARYVARLKDYDNES